MGVAVASSGSPEKIAHNLRSSGLAPLFPDPHLVRTPAGFTFVTGLYGYFPTAF